MLFFLSQRVSRRARSAQIFSKSVLVVSRGAAPLFGGLVRPTQRLRAAYSDGPRRFQTVLSALCGRQVKPAKITWRATKWLSATLAAATWAVKELNARSSGANQTGCRNRDVKVNKKKKKDWLCIVPRAFHSRRRLTRKIRKKRRRWRRASTKGQLWPVCAGCPRLASWRYSSDTHH